MTPPATLKREVSLRQLFSLAFGSIIGVGWITVLGSWLGDAGMAGAALAFVGGGLVIGMIALCYAEMAVAYPVAGGEVAYAHEVFGLRTAFLVGWLLILGYLGVVIFEVISVGWIFEVLFPELKGPVLYTVAGSAISLGGLLAGIAGVVLIAAFNIRGAKQAARLQEVLTYSLLLITLAFSVLAFMRGDLANSQPLFVANPEGLILPGILAVLVTAPFWFSGFDVIPQAMGEMSASASRRKVPLVLALAIAVAVLFYVMIITAASISLPRAELLAADLPTADALAAAFGSNTGGKWVLFAGLLGLISSWNAFAFGASRVLFALGRAGIIARGFGEVHERYHTPAKALYCISLLSLVGACFGRHAIGPVVDTGALGFCLVYVAVCLCALKHQRQQTDPQAYQMPGKAVSRVIATSLALLVTLYAFYAPLAASPQGLPLEWWLLAGWLLLGLVLYRHSKTSRQRLSHPERSQLLLTDLDNA